LNIIRIAIDADSIVFKACYRHQYDGVVNIEQAYLEFCYEIGKIRSAIFNVVQYQRGDIVEPLIVLSPKKSFRNELSSDYKITRKPLTIDGIKKLKYMIMHRLPNWSFVAPGIEADDICIYYANHYDYLVAAIDKDVLNACPTPCYNYNQRRWNQPNSKYDIERWYAKQALMGDSADNIKGAQDVGEMGANMFIDKYLGEPLSYMEFVDLFGSEEMALQSMNLVRMDRVIRINDKFVFKPWTLNEDINGFWEL